MTAVVLSGEKVDGALLRKDPNADKTATLWIIHYEKDWTIEETGAGDYYLKDTENMERDLEKPGHSSRDYCWINPGSGLYSQYSWEYATWNAGQIYGVAQSGYYTGQGACGRRDHPSTYQFPVPPAEQRQCDGGSFRILTDQWGNTFYQTVNRHEKSVWQLKTGSKGYPGRPNLFEFFVTAVAYSDLFYPEVDGQTGSYPVNPVAIQVGELGNVASDGWLCRALASGQTFDATPRVNSSRYYAYNISFGKYVLLSQCHSLIPTNRDRTALGVGEDVDVGFDYPPPVGPTAWTTSAGTLVSANNGVTLTAPDHKIDASVVAHVRDAELSVDFSVIEPSGIDHADFVEYWPYPSTTLAGAGVHLRPFVGPMNVSFYKVQIVEVGEDASDIQGYFNSHSPPSHKGPAPGKGDVWLQIQNDNSWDPNWDYATSSGWPSTWSPGSYTWDIPAKWRVGSGAEHSMTGWNQVHSISANGTMTVSKFGHTVSRTIQNVYSGQ